MTSFKAAHDSDFSSAMDAHWTLDGKPRKTLDDAVWYVNKLESANVLCGSRGGGDRGSQNHKNIGFLSNSCPDPLKNYEATELAFNVGPSSAQQRNAF